MEEEQTATLLPWADLDLRRREGEHKVGTTPTKVEHLRRPAAPCLTAEERRRCSPRRRRRRRRSFIRLTGTRLTLLNMDTTKQCTTRFSSSSSSTISRCTGGRLPRHPPWALSPRTTTATRCKLPGGEPTPRPRRTVFRGPPTSTILRMRRARPPPSSLLPLPPSSLSGSPSLLPQQIRTTTHKHRLMQKHHPHRHQGLPLLKLRQPKEDIIRASTESLATIHVPPTFLLKKAFCVRFRFLFFYPPGPRRERSRWGRSLTLREDRERSRRHRIRPRKMWEEDGRKTNQHLIYYFHFFLVFLSFPFLFFYLSL